MPDTPRGKIIDLAAKNVYGWLDVWESYKSDDMESALKKANEITGRMIDEDVFYRICKFTSYNEEFIAFTEFRPWWKFWQYEGLIENYEEKHGILMAIKYYYFMGGLKLKNTDRKKRWLEEFSNGITLDYNTHELVAVKNPKITSWSQR